MPAWIEHAAVFFAAASGALAGRGKPVDLYAFLVLGVATAVGGGTFRDLVLGLPVFWVTDSSYLVSAMMGAITTFLLLRFAVHPDRWLNLATNLGLAFFTISGTAKAMGEHHSPLVCIAMGLATATGGGVLRDVLVAEIPAVFRSETYFFATASIIGGAVYFSLCVMQVDALIAALVGSLVVLALRYGSLWFGARLPSLPVPPIRR